MKLLTSKLAFSRPNNSYWHWCPGCEELHQITARPARQVNGASWDFNQNLESPTFTPSVRISHGKTTDCHYFLTNGVIRFCTDSDHVLAGKDVPLPDIPAEVQATYMDENGR